MNRPKILLVDDDREQLQALGIYLRAKGYQLAFASDAVQAVGAVRRERPDLVLLDIGLPGGDGHMVLDRLKSLSTTAALPVIVLSAKDPAGHRDRMLAAGAEGYFQKPAEPAELATAIARLLGRADEGSDAA